MLASLLIAASAVVVLVLGLAHLLLTLFGTAFRPRDPDLQDRMSVVHPVLTRETTMWRAWVGFNASHSLGAILFGLIYGFLALSHPDILLSSWFLLAVGTAMLCSLTVLAKLYWFRIPLVGIGLATVLFIVAIVVEQV